MRFKKAIWTILVCFSLSSMAWIFLFDYHPKSDEEVARLLGISKAEIESFDYSDSWGLQDYDIVGKYQLSDATIRRFLTSSTSILFDKEYEADSSAWEKANWHKAPLDATTHVDIYKEVFDVGRGNLQRDKWISEAGQCLRSTNGYYSFYYHKKRENAFACYVLEIREKTLYIVYLKV